MRPLLTAAGCQRFQLRLLQLQLLLVPLGFPPLLPLPAAATTAVVVFLGLLRRASALPACLAAPGHRRRRPRGTATRRRIRRLGFPGAVLHLSGRAICERLRYLTHVQGRVGTIGRGHAVWHDRCAFSFYRSRSWARVRIPIDRDAHREDRTRNRETQGRGVVEDWCRKYIKILFR